MMSSTTRQKQIDTGRGLLSRVGSCPKCGEDTLPFLTEYFKPDNISRYECDTYGHSFDWHIVAP